MKIGIADMVSNFVPGSGNPLGLDSYKWGKIKPITQLKMVLDIISQSTFDYVELGMPWINGENNEFTFEDIEKIIIEKRLSVGSYCSMVPGKYKTIGDNVNWTNLNRYTTNIFSNCSKLNGSIIVYGSGDSRYIPGDYSRISAKRDLLQFLSYLSDLIEENNYAFKIAIEPLNTEECNFINSLTEANELAMEIGSPNIGILVDTYHAYRQNSNFLDELPSVIDNLIHIHIAQPEDRGWPGHFHSSNSFDFKKFFKIINNLNYKGNVTVECNFNNLKEEINLCKQFIDSVCFEK